MSPPTVQYAASAQLSAIGRHTKMKLVTYRYNDKTSCGLVTGRDLVDIPSAWPGPDAPHSVMEIPGEAHPASRPWAELPRPAKCLPLESATLSGPPAPAGKAPGPGGQLRRTRQGSLPEPGLPARAVRVAAPDPLCRDRSDAGQRRQRTRRHDPMARLQQADRLRTRTGRGHRKPGQMRQRGRGPRCRRRLL